MRVAEPPVGPIERVAHQRVDRIALPLSVLRLHHVVLVGIRVADPAILQRASKQIVKERVPFRFDSPPVALKSVRPT